MTNEEMYHATGEVKSSDKLVQFMYLLLREYLTAGQVESLMNNTADGEGQFTNGYLANYAIQLADRLTKKESV